MNLDDIALKVAHELDSEGWAAVTIQVSEEEVTEMIKSLNAIASGAGLNTCKDAANLIERLAGRK